MKTVPKVALLFVATSLVTFAQNGHYLKLDASIDTNTACYEVNLKEAGLGNSGLTSVTYTLAATATYTVACVNKGGNTVQGQPKSGTSNSAENTTLLIRNGSTSGIVSLCPAAFALPNPGCTGSQQQVITSAAYANVTLNDNLPPDVTAGIVSLPSLGPVPVFVILQ